MVRLVGWVVWFYGSFGFGVRVVLGFVGFGSSFGFVARFILQLGLVS